MPDECAKCLILALPILFPVKDVPECVPLVTELCAVSYKSTLPPPSTSNTPDTSSTIT